MTNNDSDELGRTFTRFIDLVELGRGNTGIVHRAVDPLLKNRVVAVKVPLLANQPNRNERTVRFMREATSMAAFEDAHIVSVHMVDECDGKPFIVREFIDGPTLEQAALAKTICLSQTVRVVAILAHTVAAYS